MYISTSEFVSFKRIQYSTVLDIKHNFTFILETAFTAHPGKNCSDSIQNFNQYFYLDKIIHDDIGYYKNCKKYCVDLKYCHGFIVDSGKCIFANKRCRSGLVAVDLLETMVFLKEVN